MSLKWNNRSDEKIKEYDESHNNNRIQNLLVVKLRVVPIHTFGH